jgi:hypothetical protein
MLPTTPSDLDIPSQWIAQGVQVNLTEIWALAREICEAATEACACAANLGQETTQLCERARQLQIVNARLRAEGVRRRHNLRPAS